MDFHGSYDIPLPPYLSPWKALEQLLVFLQAAATAEDPKLLLVVTRGAHEAGASFDGACALWGLLRSARIEMPRLVIKALDVDLKAARIGFSDQNHPTTLILLGEILHHQKDG